MSKRSLPLTILFFLLLLPACRKDELTLPSKVIFKFELIPHQEADNLKGGPPFDVPGGRMTIDRGTLTIESIKFDGKRDEAKDYSFVSNLPFPLIVDLESGETNQEVSFDIPQGVYNHVEIFLSLGVADEPSVALDGIIRRGPWEKIPIRFEYNIREQIRIWAEPGKLRESGESGGQHNKIVFRKDTPSIARIVVDAGSLFQFVNLPEIQNATPSVRDGEKIIIISFDSNTEIFNTMGQRLDRSFRVIID